MTQPLIHGGDWAGFEAQYGRPPLDFSANVSPLGLPEAVRRAAEASLPHADRYPDPLCRALRAKLAEKEHMPAYIVFSNAALRDMCRKKPSSLAAFRQVSGVGIIKSQKYGKAFIKEIAAYTAEKSADK